MEPVSSAVAKVAVEGGKEAVKDVGGVLARMFGPAADVFGVWLAAKADLRLNNLRRIAERSQAKLTTRPEALDWHVNPRVAHRILEDGSFCDDEVMVDYLSGLLAASRSPSGRDDRAIYWSSVIASLSSLQIRLHYILYREWAIRFSGSDLNLGEVSQRNRIQIVADLQQISNVLFLGRDDQDYDAGFSHAMYGLVAANLVADFGGWGSTDEGRKNFPVLRDVSFERYLLAAPSPSGLELFGWAQGKSDVISTTFVTKASAFEIDPPLPRLDDVFFPEVSSLAPKQEM